MKVLTLKAYYEPEAAASAYLTNNTIEDLIKDGHEVEIITPMPSRGISREVRKHYKKKKVEKKHNNKLIINRFAMFREPKNAFLRALRYFFTVVAYIIIGIRLRKIDVINVGSTPPIIGLSAAIIKIFKKAPFVYSLQDVFPDSLVATGLTHKGSLLWKIGRIIENFSYRNADKIIVISEGFKKNIMAKGVHESKIEVIYNWVDENEVVPVDRNNNILFERYGLDKNRFYVTYNGNIGLTQNMDLLLEVAEQLKEKQDIHFVVMGEGAYKKQVEEKIATDQLKNVTLLPFQPYEEISHVFSMGDVGLVISKENVGQNSVPSKTWSIMSAARPVLANFDENSELQEIIETNNAGIFTKAGDKKALCNAILELYNNPELGETMGKNGRQFILNNLTRDIGTAKYVEAIKSVVANYKSK